MLGRRHLAPGTIAGSIGLVLSTLGEVAMRRAGLLLRLQKRTWSAIVREEQDTQDSVEHLPCLHEVPRIEPGRCLRVGAQVQVDGRWDNELRVLHAGLFLAFSWASGAQQWNAQEL